MSCEEVKVQLGKLITAINTHGYQPRDVLVGTIATFQRTAVVISAQAKVIGEYLV